MKTKHTQGEWKDQGNSLVDANRIVSTETHLICRLTGADFETDDEMEANAKLIAAAPELLEALIKIKDQYESLLDDPELDEFLNWPKSYDASLQEANEAIKKATIN